jgi:Gnt-I system low-affinity gluconate transporter
VSTLTLVLTAVGSVLLLLFLVMKARMHAFLALMVVSIGAGLFSGMPLDKIAATMEKGMGGTLGFLAIVVALGAMFGKILHETGAVDQIAVKMLKSFGHSRAHYAIGLAGLICALPLFFEVAIVLLISVAFSMARHTGTNLVKLVIPLFAGVAAAAAFLLPGPAPMLLASQMHADFGWMILIGLCAAIPGMIIAGPLWGNFISRYVELNIPDDITEPHLGEGKMPSFGFSLSLILLPLVLVGLKTIAARFVPVGSSTYEWFEFIGHPFTAILVACLVAIYGLAIRQGMPKDKVMEICGHALQPAGIILLVIGAGGVFKQVLVDSGVGPALGEALTGMGLPIAITCFVLAAAVRIIQGSATVACLTAVGLVMPVIEQLNFSGAQMAALSICIAGGSIVVSHVNDAGFWLFGKFTGATEAQTLKTWTMMETILGTVGAIVGMIAFPAVELSLVARWRLRLPGLEMSTHPHRRPGKRKRHPAFLQHHHTILGFQPTRRFQRVGEIAHQILQQITRYSLHIIRKRFAHQQMRQKLAVTPHLVCLRLEKGKTGREGFYRQAGLQMLRYRLR